METKCENEDFIEKDKNSEKSSINEKSLQEGYELLVQTPRYSLWKAK